MSFIPRFTFTGGPFVVRAYAIAASEEWDLYDVLALNGDGALIEAADATSDVLGTAITKTGNVTAGQSDSNELRSYLAALTTGKHEPVCFFEESSVFETDDYNSEAAATYADIGERADLELVSGSWGINNGTAGTGFTPNFAIIDITRVSGKYLVVPDTLAVAGVFQLYNGAV